MLGIGEVKWGQVMGLPHLDRLREIRGLLIAQGRSGADGAKLRCFSAAGFTDDLQQAAEKDDAVRLVTVDDLYRDQPAP